MNSKTLTILTVIAACLTGCGIDRGGSPDSIAFEGSVTAGKIESVGTSANTVIINGQELDTASSSIVINGNSANSSQLVAGAFAVATTLASGQAGRADRIELDYNVAGGSAQPGATSGNVMQLGQSINLDSLNQVSPFSDPTTPGSPDYAFSGYVTPTGVIDATAAIPYSASEPLLLTGFVSNADPAMFTFTIGNQVVDYSQAQVISTQSGSVTDDIRLRIELDSNVQGATLSAISLTQVPLIDPSLGANASVSLTGYYTDSPSASAFRLSNLTITTDSNTVFTNAALAALNANSLVQVDGLLLSDRTVLAQSILQINQE